MASTLGLLAATLTLLSSALAFSPDQCNVTTYGAPERVACNTLLSNIAKLGVGNTSYLFIPSQFPTPAGLSNGTRKNFPQTWSFPGCKAALVPIEVTTSSVTYDTSSYQDLATAGGVIVQQCISNATRAGGGWELAGDNQDLVLHLFAVGSEIDKTINQQTTTQIAATSEDEINNAEIDDPAYGAGGDGFFGSSDPFNDTYAGNSTIGGGVPAPAPAVPAASAPAPAAPVAPVTSSATVVGVYGSFNYLGCQVDSSVAPTLSSLAWSGTELTVQRCGDYCAAYQYMGLEQGSQCFCGGDADGKGVHPATLITEVPNNCTAACNGDVTQICGGTGWLTVYQNTNIPSVGVNAVDASDYGGDITYL